jgi:hypothetical protein
METIGKDFMNRRLIILFGVALALLLPGSALAASSTCSAYNPQGCGTVQGTSTTRTPSTPAVEATTTTASSSLPFTGIDAGLVLAIGATLLAGGLLVRRFSHQ